MSARAGASDAAAIAREEKSTTRPIDAVRMRRTYTRRRRGLQTALIDVAGGDDRAVVGVARALHVGRGRVAVAVVRQRSRALEGEADRRQVEPGVREPLL